MPLPKRIRSLIALLLLGLLLPPLLPAQNDDGGARLFPPGGAPERYRPSIFNLSASGGLGLVAAVSPETLSSGEFAFSIHEMNYDRHPTDVDFFDFSFQGAVGLWDRTEIFLSLTPWLRTTAVSLDPVRFPIPPLDLIVDTFPDPALRPEPYFVFAPEVPFKTVDLLHLTRNGAFSSASGDIVVGLKRNIRSESGGDKFGLGVRGFVEIPTERPEYNAPYPEWRVVAGVSGEVDIGADLLFSKKWGRSELLANAGYKRTSGTDRGLRLQFVDSSQSTPDTFLVGEPVEMGLELPDEVRLSAGATFPFARLMSLYWWAFGEVNYKRYVGAHTPTERLVHPLEVSAGIQYNVPWFPAVAVGAAYQRLLNRAGHGDPRTSSLLTADGTVGDINFSPGVDPDLATEVASYLTERGVAFSDRSSRVFSTNNPAFDAWRNIPAEPGTIRAEGPQNILGFMTWRIGSIR